MDDIDVFISYSRQDWNIVEKICNLLKDNNISYWLDQEKIHDGSRFLAEISTAIRKCKITLFVSSNDSNQSIFTAKEVAFAFNSGKYIIPYKIDNSKFSENLELILSDLNFVEAVPFNIEKAQKLVSDIKSLLYGDRRPEVTNIPPRVYIDITQWDQPNGKLLKYLKHLFSEKHNN